MTDVLHHENEKWWHLGKLALSVHIHILHAPLWTVLMVLRWCPWAAVLPPNHPAVSSSAVREQAAPPLSVLRHPIVFTVCVPWQYQFVCLLSQFILILLAQTLLFIFSILQLLDQYDYTFTSCL